MSDKMICTTCGYVGYSERTINGNIGVEIFLWLIFLLPGIIYSIYRSSTKMDVCPKCKDPTMIPVTSPIGEKLYSAHESTLSPETKLEESKKESRKMKTDTIVRIIVIVFIIWIVVSVFSAVK